MNIKLHLSKQPDVILFLIAGSFMLINTAFLWVRHFSGYTLSILWPAIPAIIAFSVCVFGLFKLYHRISPKAPKLAKSGALLALVASCALGIAAIWIFRASVFGDGVPTPLPTGLGALVGLFIVAMVLAFLNNAVACLMDKGLRNLGYLLIVPVAMWTLMLVVSIFKGLNVGLSLDFYTNAVIGLAFLATGLTLSKRELK